MNRAERRAYEKRKRAISRELVRMEKPEQYHQGFMDGGKAMTEAAYAAFCSAMADYGLLAADILPIMRMLDDKLLIFAGDNELINEAFEKTGILVDFSQVFSNDKFTLKQGT